MLRTLLVRLALVAAVAATAPVAARAQGFEIVANPSVGASEISGELLAKIFLKQLQSFGGGKVVPVDQGKDSPVRVAFTKAVHGRSVFVIEGYWQQQILSGGTLPPAQKAGDDAVIAFVKATPGAIGYVATGASTSGVKVLKIAP